MFLFVLASKLAMCLFPLEIFQHTLEKISNSFFALQTRMLQGMFECPEYCTLVRFHTEGAGLEFSTPQPQFSLPSRNLEIEYGYYCGAINISYSILHVAGHKYV